MKFRIEHGVEPGTNIGIAVIFGLDELDKLQDMIVAVKGSAPKVPVPSPYVPLYRQHGIDPATMYPAKDDGNGVGRGEA